MKINFFIGTEIKVFEFQEGNAVGTYLQMYSN
jgi:hypothetical protein